MSLPPLPKSLNMRRQQKANGGYEMFPAYASEEMLAYGQQCYAEGERKWRQAVDDQLVMCEMVTSDDPRESLERLINWNCSVALDPLVSSDAKALIAAGADAEMERCAKLCEQRAADHWHDYKNGPRHIKGSAMSEHASDEADACASAIRSAKSE